MRELKDERAAAGQRHASSPSSAASPRPRAPRSFGARPLSISSSGRRAIIGCRSCIARARIARKSRSSTPTFPRRTSSRACRARRRHAAATAFLTVQEGCDKFCTFCVVPYTRGMEYSRPVADIEREARALVASGVREITLLGQNVNAYHGEGPDGAAWSLARAHPALGAHRWPRAAALHDEPSARHERRSHRRARRREEADALSAPAVSVGLRSHPRRHEPQAHGARTTSTSSAASAPRSRRSPSRPTSSSASPARPTPSSRRRSRLSQRGGLRAGLLVQVQPAPRHAGSQARSSRCPKRSKSARLARLQELLERQQAAFNARCVGRKLPVLFEKPGAARASSSAARPTCRRCTPRPAPSILGRIVPVEISGVRPQ